MTIRIVVADQSEASFYDTERAGHPLRFVQRLTDPKAHWQEREFSSDRPGRFSNHAAADHGRRGATAHHGAGGERSLREHEAQLFARQIAVQLERGHHDGAMQQLILVAGPRFLGLLREALPPALRTIVVDEVRKDLVHEPPSALAQHLAAAFSAHSP